jgi:hypothetical protein
VSFKIVIQEEVKARIRAREMHEVITLLFVGVINRHVRNYALATAVASARAIATYTANAYRKEGKRRHTAA